LKTKVRTSGYSKMSQTDRQTDKASHWNAAIFDEGDGFSGQWALLERPPNWVKRVHKKKEICPTTGREHQQVHVECVRQVRLSQLCSWIKHTKWTMVVGKAYIENSINYIAKEATTAPGAKVEILDNPEQYLRLSDILQEMAKYSLPAPTSGDIMYFKSLNLIDTNEWKRITGRMIKEDVTWVNKLCNPTLPRFWKDWGHIFINKFSEKFVEDAVYIIEDSGPEASTAEGDVEFEEDDWSEYKFLD